MDKRRAFTLIELLVVIAIIALLMAMLIPALEAARARVRDMLCTSNQRQVALLVLMFIEDNEGVTADIYPPQSTKNPVPPGNWCNGYEWIDPATGKISSTDREKCYWGVAYIDYVKNRKIFGCPGFRDVAARLINTGGVNQDQAYLINEAGFGINAFGSNRNISDIRQPSKFIFCTDHVEPRVEQGSIDMFHNDGPGTMNLTHYRPGGNPERMPQYRGIFRHAVKLDDDYQTGGKASILWLDGHVSWLWETTGDNVPERWYTGK
ncbi:MAG TPA: type II secretion system protein [Sedimentisphaerales bacterium]|nr:type II secretion system protein [Sedimentisphaerales bacterium]